MRPVLSGHRSDQRPAVRDRAPQHARDGTAAADAGPASHRAARHAFRAPRPRTSRPGAVRAGPVPGAGAGAPPGAGVPIHRPRAPPRTPPAARQRQRRRAQRGGGSAPPRICGQPAAPSALRRRSRRSASSARPGAAPLGLSGGELVAALAAAGSEDGATRAGTHPQPETVRTGTTAVVRLEGALTHGRGSIAIPVATRHADAAETWHTDRKSGPGENCQTCQRYGAGRTRSNRRSQARLPARTARTGRRPPAGVLRKRRAQQRGWPRSGRPGASAVRHRPEADSLWTTLSGWRTSLLASRAPELPPAWLHRGRIVPVAEMCTGCGQWCGQAARRSRRTRRGLGRSRGA